MFYFTCDRSFIDVIAIRTTCTIRHADSVYATRIRRRFVATLRSTVKTGPAATTSCPAAWSEIIYGRRTAFAADPALRRRDRTSSTRINVVSLLSALEMGRRFESSTIRRFFPTLEGFETTSYPSVIIFRPGNGSLSAISFVLVVVVVSTRLRLFHFTTDCRQLRTQIGEW